MAYIEKRRGKKGVSYRIQVRCGNKKFTETYHPAATTAAEIRYEVQQEAIRYEYLTIYNDTHDEPLPVITLHDLRHTGASLLLEHGIGIETVSKRLGHSKPSITLDVYGEALDGIDRKAAAKIDELLDLNDQADRQGATCCARSDRLQTPENH